MTTGFGRRMRLAALAGATALALGAGAPLAAAEAPASFAIPAGTLDAALIAYARRTGRQILYTSALVAPYRVDGLVGRYGADAALERLLAGTGIVAERRGGRLIVLRAPRADAPPAPAEAGAPPPAEPPSPAPRQAALEADGTIVVTGTHIRTARPPASPVIRYDRAAIDRTGYATAAEVVASLPQNFGGTASEDTTLSAADRTVPNIGLGSGVNLRGLGADATLTLVNGRRTAGSGGKGDFTDLSLIPTAAVERIEVLTDGASAIYGSDAVGGVVNLILRQPFDGAESRLRLGHAGGGDADVLASQLVATRWPDGGALVAYEFQERSALPSSARRYTASADLRPLGGSDRRLFASRPATILAPGPGGALVPAFAVPAGQPGTSLRPGDFRPGANLENQRAGTDLLPRQTRHNVYATAEQAVGDELTFYAEGRFAHRRFAFAGAPATALFQVTAANPFFVSPNGATSNFLAYSFADELGPSRGRGRVEALSGTLGGRLDLGSWRIDAYASGARERTRSRNDNLVNTTRLAEALGAVPDNPATAFSTARDGFFNPYGDAAPNARAVLDFVGSAFSREATDAKLGTLSLKADGPLVTLGTEPVRLAVGAALRRELFDRAGAGFFTGVTPTPLQPTDAGRTVKAVFAEVLAPVAGALDLSLALRHEAYSDFGGSTDPKLGLAWRPSPAFTLRGTYGRSFRAPALREVRDALRVSATQIPGPAGGTSLVLFLSGGNPDLGAEEARSYTLGGRLAPWADAGPSLDMTWFDTRFSERIAQPALEAVLTALRDPALSPFVMRVDPANPADLARVQALISGPGSIVPATLPPSAFRAIVDGRFVNTASVRVRGLDARLDQGFDLGDARGALSLDLSYLVDFAEQLTPAAPRRDRVGEVGFPADLRLRATASLDWSRAGLTVSLLNVGGGRDRASVPTRRVEAWTTLDAQLRLRAGPRLGGIEAALNVQNLLGSPPPFVDRATGVGYDAANADPLGRTVSLQLTKRW